MNYTARIRQKFAIATVLLVQLVSVSLFAMPITVHADTEPETTAVVCPPVNGTKSPTGSAARTFTYNPETCLYENDYYTWNPATKIYTPIKDVELREPRLNAEGTAYEHQQWEYSPAKGRYELRTISNPVTTITVPASATNTTAPSDGGARSQTIGNASISNSGADSTNEINSVDSTQADIDIINNTSVLTTLDSVSVSGDASVLQNTNGGSASTGDATAVANYLALIQSGWDPTNGEIATFNADIYGSFTGDLLFDPSLILDTGAGSTNTINDSDTTRLNVTIQDNASIQNDINLTAKSGDATVSENTKGGDATTGDAKAVANVVNMINSSINSQKGFIGTINIHGSLQGDFLLPPALLAQLQNTGAGSNNAIQQNNNTDAHVNLTSNASIYNNFNIGAFSGNALVDANTEAGSATTGTATTNVEQQNYVGVNGDGQKGLLVFVNVMGQWVGFVNPNFSTIGNTGANSDNSITNNNTTNLDLDVVQNHSITNNINLHAQSGDATVSRNTSAGDARSGDAYAGANVLNMIDSNLNYSDWFGVLFINVFGSWSGSFGADTVAGSPAHSQSVSEAPAEAERNTPQPGRHTLAETTSGPGSSYAAGRTAAGVRTTAAREQSPALLGASSDDVPPSAAANTSLPSAESSGRSFAVNWWVLAIGALFGAGFAVRGQEINFSRVLPRRVRP